MEEKETTLDVEGEEDGILEEEEFEVKRTTLFYTRAHGHQQQNAWREKLSHTSFDKRANQFRSKRSCSSEETKHVEHDAPGELNRTQAGWTNRMPNIPRLLQE